MPFRVTFNNLKERLNSTDFISNHFVMVEVTTKVIECDAENED